MPTFKLKTYYTGNCAMQAHFYFEHKISSMVGGFTKNVTKLLSIGGFEVNLKSTTIMVKITGFAKKKKRVEKSELASRSYVF